MKAAVIVLSWNAAPELAACLDALARQHRPPERTLVVDNASADGSAAMVAARFPAVELIRNSRNLGFSGGMNVGLRALLAGPGRPDAAVLLNQDTAVDPGWLEALLAPLADRSVGAVGSKIRFEDGRLQHAGAVIEWPLGLVRHVGWGEPERGQYDEERDYELLTAAAIALRLEAVEAVGLFDEGYAPAYFEDVDLCWRLRRAGHRLVYAPAATLAHQESHSTRDELTRMAYYHRGRLRYLLKRCPLEELADAFLAAEAAYVARRAAAPEGRALRWAYAETLSALPAILAARAPYHVEQPAGDALREMLIALQRAHAAALYQGALASAAALRW
jgi:GT2 family glycosyltransferase